MEKSGKSRKSRKSSLLKLAGHFLIAMPGMMDKRFERSVIYICSHTASGAMGLVINQPLDEINFVEIVSQVVSDKLSISDIADDIVAKQLICRGGPVEQGRGLVLHSADYNIESSMKIDKDVRLTSSIEVLRDIATGKGPKKSLLALGYSGWSSGQLEAEIAQNGWLSCKASADIIFVEKWQSRYDKALSLMGIDEALLSASAGHA